MEMISKTNAEHYAWGDGCDGWHLVKTRALSVIQESVPPGTGEVRHFHERAEQFFFILSGVATFELQGRSQEITAHHGIHVPAGCPHQLHNHGPLTLEFILVSTPPSHGDRKPAPIAPSTTP